MTQEHHDVEGHASEKPAKAGRAEEANGEAGRRSVSDEARGPRGEGRDTGSASEDARTGALLDAALTRENLQKAWKRVKANKGAAGVDGLDIEQTRRWLCTAWPGVREQLPQGTYRPSPVRRVMIPKPDGTQRELGIPTVMDRLIQQALRQVLQPMLDGDVQRQQPWLQTGARRPGCGEASPRPRASGAAGGG